MDFQLKADAKPYHGRPYSIPQIHERALRIEINRLVAIEVLESVQESEWGAPSFITPKNNDTVRFLTDFRELNKRLKRKQFPIPNIQHMLQKT